MLFCFHYWHDVEAPVLQQGTNRLDPTDTIEIFVEYALVRNHCRDLTAFYSLGPHDHLRPPMIVVIQLLVSLVLSPGKFILFFRSFWKTYYPIN